MNSKRVTQLLDSIKKDLLKEGDVKTFNVFDLFEVVESIARDYIGDETPVLNCAATNQEEISWISVSDFCKKYKFIGQSRMYDMLRYFPELRKLSKQQGKHHRYHLQERGTLEFFANLSEEKDGALPLIKNKVRKYLEETQHERSKRAA